MQQNERQEWLDNLKVGDKVAMDLGSFGFRNWTITEITKITPTRRMETKNGYKLSNNGYEMGKKDAWTPSRKIVPLTEDILNEIKKKKLLSNIDNTDFKSLSIDKLEKIYKIIETE